jgi:hypothetical protein
MKKYLAASLAVFVFILAFDHFVAPALLGPVMASIAGAVAEYSRTWEAFGDLCAALVMTGLYARTRSVFGATPKGGAVYGVYAGLLVNFPTWQWMTLYFGWPYRAAWTFTIALFALDVVAGAIMGAVYQAMDKRAA